MLVAFGHQRLLVHWSLVGSERQSRPLHSSLYQT